MKLTTHILSLLCLIGFCACLVTGYFVYNTVVSNTIENLSDAQLERTENTIHDLEITLHEAFRGIVAIANMYSHGNLPEKEDRLLSRHALMDVVNELATPWDAVHIFDREGSLRLSTQYLPGKFREQVERNALHIDALLTAELENTWTTDLILDPETQEAVILFSAPIRDKTKPKRPILGAAIGYFSWLRFSELLFVQGSDTRLILMNRDGDFIASNDPYTETTPFQVSYANHETVKQYLNNEKPKTILQPSGEIDSRVGDRKGVVPSLADPDELVIQTIAVEQSKFDKAGNGWILVAETPINAVLHQARQIGIQQAFLNSGIIFLGFGLTYLVLRREVTSPIAKLNQAVSSITHGLFKTRIATHNVHTQEIQTLSSAFNRMAERLEDAREHSNQAHRLQRMVDQSVNGYMTIDRKFEITYLNDAAKSIFRKHAHQFRKRWPTFEPDKLIGSNIDFFLKNPQRQRPRLTNLENLPIRTDIRIGNIILHITITAIYNELGQFEGNAVEWEDVTEQRRATRLQKQAEQALRDTVEELDQFTYVASHDLRTPLQGISLLAEWIAEDDLEHLSPNSAQNLERIHERCKRLGRLLDDLLTYSRSGKVLGEIREVDVKGLLDELKEILDSKDNYKIRVDGPLPIFLTYNAPFELVLRNLIQNAIKHHDRPAGNIIVQCDASHKDHYRFTVTDDGPGIPEQHQDKIFGMFRTFQKLPDNDQTGENQSSGIGLAVIKKTVESFKCEVKVDSERGKGSTFTFTWPKKVKAKSENSDF